MGFESRSCLTCLVIFEPKDTRAKYCCSKCRNNSPSKKIRTRAFQQKRRDTINAIKLERGCRVCGYKGSAEALQFNHISGDKQFNISHDPKTAWGKITAEIAKCEVLCANCHSEHTYAGRHWHTKRKNTTKRER